MSTNLTKVVLQGAGAGEIFTTGFYINNTDWGSVTDLSGFVDDFVTALIASTEWDPARELLAPDQAWTGVEALSYPNPLLPAEFAANGTIGHAQGVGTGVNRLPLQAAAVGSLGTGLSGASHRGRMYWPLTGVSLITGHYIDPDDTDLVANVIMRALERAQFAASGRGQTDAVPVVFSPTLNTDSRVRTVSVDNRPDVQRRRANSQTATARSTVTVI